TTPSASRCRNSPARPARNRSKNSGARLTRTLARPWATAATCSIVTGDAPTTTSGRATRGGWGCSADIGGLLGGSRSLVEPQGTPRHAPGRATKLEAHSSQAALEGHSQASAGSQRHQKLEPPHAGQALQVGPHSADAGQHEIAQLGDRREHRLRGEVSLEAAPHLRDPQL